MISPRESALLQASATIYAGSYVPPTLNADGYIDREGRYTTSYHEAGKDAYALLALIEAWEPKAVTREKCSCDLGIGIRCDIHTPEKR